MQAMLLNKLSLLEENTSPLQITEMPQPVPAGKELLVKVTTCGVCHTELDEIEGRTPPTHLPMIPGHQVIGRVESIGRNTTRFTIGDRVGVAWIYSACGKCKFCLRGDENLCPWFRATGRDANGGYAQYMTVHEDFAYRIPDVFSDAEAAPLLCAGAIGYRSLKLTGLNDGETLGLTGFGASAHLVMKMARHRFPNSKFFVFARSEGERAFAMELGASWAGDSGDESPEKCDSIIDTTPIWKPLLSALHDLRAGGRLVINAIRKEDADKSSFAEIDYPSHLWMEKEIKSVANVTRADVREFLELAAAIPIKPEIEEFPLEKANDALAELKARKIRGAKVLRIS